MNEPYGLFFLWAKPYRNQQNPFASVYQYAIQRFSGFTLAGCFTLQASKAMPGFQGLDIQLDIVEGWVA
jgi:hypothetical protein